MIKTERAQLFEALQVSNFLNTLHSVVIELVSAIVMLIPKDYFNNNL